MLTLRHYQQQAVDAVYGHLRDRDDNPVVVIPTGGGKTPVIATLCKDAVTKWNGRVLVLAHVKELLEQAAEKLNVVCPEVEFGIYSAGLKRRDTENPVIVAGIQSVYKRACELDAFDLIIIDESHMIPTEGDGMYRQFLADAATVNPNVRTIGLTATPFRLKSGMICSPDHFLNHVCYTIGVKELIQDGYLCALISRAGSYRVDFSSLHMRGGEFISDELEDLMDTDALVEAACSEIVELSQDRNSTLIFATGVNHGRHVQSVLKDRHGIDCGFVCGDTPPKDRAEVLGKFKDGSLGYLCNVNVLTTGFDAPNIDCVALLRPTLSTGLYYQMVGRGFRLHNGKQNSLVLDYGGNVVRHGPVDQLSIVQYDRANGEAPGKECPECHTIVAAGYSVCPDCGHTFPPRQRKSHEAAASDAGVLSGQTKDMQYEVRDTRFSVHIKRDADEGAPKTMRVEYHLGLDYWVSEWVCFEHNGYARQMASQWWKGRSPDPVPATAEQAVELANDGRLASAKNITVRSRVGEQYVRIIAHELYPLPDPMQ